uniref:Solute carrier family 40 member n=1 Tax=Ditylenchus dipsaci TaxID=166011 RepID=A0A915CY75_9BILA
MSTSTISTSKHPALTSNSGTKAGDTAAAPICIDDDSQHSQTTTTTTNSDQQFKQSEPALLAFSTFSTPLHGLYFSCVGDRLWTFAIVLLLEHLGGMRLVSANQLVEGISAMFLSTYVGNWLDRHDRKQGALTVLALNNVCVAFSAALLAVCLSLSVDKSSSGNDRSTLYVFCLVLSILFCAISKVASEGQKMAFTKDWIVVMAHKDQSNSLSKRNAIMTTIDQMSSVVAPLLTGYILVFGGYRLACFVFVGWNMLSWAAERYLLSKVYEQVKELSVRERNLKDMSDPEFKEEIEVLLERKRETSSSSYNVVSKRASKNILRFWRRMQKTIGAYGRQQVFAAAFGLSLLYMTVLGFDAGQCVRHIPKCRLCFGHCGCCFLYIVRETNGCSQNRIYWSDYSTTVFVVVCYFYLVAGSPFNPRAYAVDWTIEKWISSSDAANHPTSLVIAPYLGNETLEETRNLITPTFSSNYSNHGLHIDWKDWTVQGHSIISIVVFFCGITFARLGLWMADLSITQIMQESIAEEERNTVWSSKRILPTFQCS